MYIYGISSDAATIGYYPLFLFLSLTTLSFLAPQTLVVGQLVLECSFRDWHFQRLGHHLYFMLEDRDIMYA